MVRLRSQWHLAGRENLFASWMAILRVVADVVILLFSNLGRQGSFAGPLFCILTSTACGAFLLCPFLAVDGGGCCHALRFSRARPSVPPRSPALAVVARVAVGLAPFPPPTGRGKWRGLDGWTGAGNPQGRTLALQGNAVRRESPPLPPSSLLDQHFYHGAIITRSFVQIRIPHRSGQPAKGDRRGSVPPLLVL